MSVNGAEGVAGHSRVNDQLQWSRLAWRHLWPFAKSERRAAGGVNARHSDIVLARAWAVGDAVNVIARGAMSKRGGLVQRPVQASGRHLGYNIIGPGTWLRDDFAELGAAGWILFMGETMDCRCSMYAFEGGGHLPGRSLMSGPKDRSVRSA